MNGRLGEMRATLAVLREEGRRVGAANGRSRGGF